MKIKWLIVTLVAATLTTIIVASCVSLLPDLKPASIWTPAPISGTPASATRSANILPTLPPVTPAPTMTAPPASPTPAPTPTAPPATELPPTPDPNLVSITEDDILRSVAAGVVEQGGATLEGLAVDFADDRMTLSATRLVYGMIEVRDLRMVGRLAASEGQLRLETESLIPRGLVTALIPTLMNQALAQYTSQWYIEEVRTLEGRLELRIR